MTRVGFIANSFGDNANYPVKDANLRFFSSFSNATSRFDFEALLKLVGIPIEV